MKIATSAGALIAIGLLSGCASNTPTAPTAQNEFTDRICQRKARTGSRIPKSTCYTRGELELMKIRSREFVRSGGRRGAVMMMNRH